MFKQISLFTTSLSALVMACAAAVLLAQPTAAQTAKNLKCKGCVVSKDVKNNSIKSKDIKDGQVKDVDLASNAVTSAKVQDGSVTAVDLGDEAGVEFIGGGGSVPLSSGTLTVVRSVTLTAPESGFVIANASGEFLLAANAFAECLLSTNLALDASNRMFAGGVNDAHSQIFGMTQGFAVGAGTTTFNLLCRESGGNVTVFNSDLTAIYAPTRY